MNEIVKDSGSTQEFATGAHRDNATGKGRCDLLPLLAASMALNNDPVLESVNQFMESRDPKHLAVAIRQSANTVSKFQYTQILTTMRESGIEMEDLSEAEDKGAMLNASIAHMLLEVSKLYEAGAVKYGANNWQLGMPANRYIDSGIRHYLKTLRGDIDEPHYRGFIWNLLCAMWTCEHMPDMNYAEKPKRN